MVGRSLEHDDVCVFFFLNFHEIHLKYRHLITKQRATYDKYVCSLVKYFEENYLNTFKVFRTL